MLENLPGAHDTQLLLPFTVVLYVPAEQLPPQEEDPVKGAEVPFAHGVQATDPIEPAKVSIGQSLQLNAALPAENVPSIH
jgi:hypothetical protein